MTTTNLLIPLVETNQSQKEVTVNEAIQLFENKLVEVVEVKIEDGIGITVVDGAAVRESYCLNLVNGAAPPTADFDMELPGIKGPVIVRNLTAYTATINVTGDATTVSVATGGAGLFYVDGTTLAMIVGGSVTGATAFTGLTDTPGNYTGAALKQVRVNADATGLEFTTPDTQMGISEQADDYTLVAGDAWKLIAMNSATAVTLTVPADATVNFPIGTQILVMQLGAGQVTVAEGATGVEIMTVSTLSTLGQYSVARLIKLDADTWSIDGSLEGAAGVDTFIGRPDTPPNYSGAALKQLRVKSDATALEFVDAAYDVGTFCAGKPSASEALLRFVAARAFTLPASLTGSQVKAGTAATATANFDMQKNGSSIGTISFAASGTTATFTFASAVSFAAGDILAIVAPGTADATLADISITLAGTRG